MSEVPYIKVARGWFEHPFFANDPLTEREAWMWLIEQAAWKARSFRIGKHVVPVGRGQIAASERYLAQKWQWHASKVRRFLARLQAAEMVEAHSTREYTVITLCNYDLYQGERSTDEAPTETPAKRDRSTNEAATGQQAQHVTSGTQTENGEQRSTSGAQQKSDGGKTDAIQKNAKNKSPSPSRATRLPADWTLPDEWRAYCRTKRPDLNPDSVAEDFRDYWHARAGPDASKTDWFATWRRWVRNQRAGNGNGVGNGRRQRVDPSPSATTLSHYEISVQRLKNYRPGKFWPATWGHRPEDGGGDLHPRALAEWQQQQRGEAA